MMNAGADSCAIKRREDDMFTIWDLTFRYPGTEENTIRGLDFEIEDGEIFGLLGPSGVGKTTTQKIMVKMLGQYGGQVLYRGKDLKSYGRNFYQEVGVGFEVPVHFSKLTAAENLTFFSNLYENTVDTDDLLVRLGLYQDRDKKVGEFSKGMKVRLNFARALLNDPRILFLDEPTIGLDPSNARIIKDMICEFREGGGTVLLTTHLMNDVEELCDRVAFMARGKIAEVDSPKNLKLKHGLRRVDIEYLDNGEMAQASFDLDRLSEEEEFFDIARNHTVVTMHSKETTLDDIFIKVTGAET